MQVHILGEALQGRTGHAAGREVLEKLYFQVTGRAMPAIAIGDRGKPCFENALWHFSITHTKTHVFCALAQCPVGIDGEELARSVPEKLAQRVLSASEYAQYAAAADRQRAFLHFWVLKEAAAKCTGRGLRYPENHTNFMLTDSRVREMDGCLVAVVTEEDYAV